MNTRQRLRAEALAAQPDWHTCDECGGEGTLPADTGPSGSRVLCPECNGEGGWPEDEA